MMKPLTLLTAGASLFLAGLVPQPTSAAITCQGPDQVTKRGLIRTPYCEDAYLAKLTGYSPRAVRQDPRIKRKACQRVGYNLSLSKACFGIVPSLLVPGT